MKKFIRLKVKDHLVVHGYDYNNKEIEEVVKKDQWVEKLIAVDRIQSIGEKFVLTTYAFDRIIYWEYEGGLKKISQQLKDADLIVEFRDLTAGRLSTNHC